MQFRVGLSGPALFASQGLRPLFVPLNRLEPEGGFKPVRTLLVAGSI
jgi:hypothetical protein